MSKNSDHIKRWSIETKQRMVDSMGGKCVCCGYNKCSAALEFHHIDPKQKTLSFGGIRANPISWAKIIVELRKCVLLCSNCHKEVEAGIAFLPTSYPIFNESFAIKEFRTPRIRLCSNCGNKLETFNKSKRLCSDTCRELKKQN